MKLKERDELLSRLEERSLNTWRSIEDVKNLLEKQNGRIRRNSKFIYLVIGALSASGIGFGAVSWLG